MFEKAIKSLGFAKLLLYLGVLIVTTAEITLRIAQSHVETETDEEI